MHSNEHMQEHTYIHTILLIYKNIFILMCVHTPHTHIFSHGLFPRKVLQIFSQNYLLL